MHLCCACLELDTATQCDSVRNRRGWETRVGHRIVLWLLEKPCLETVVTAAVLFSCRRWTCSCAHCCWRHPASTKSWSFPSTGERGVSAMPCLFPWRLQDEASTCSLLRPGWDEWRSLCFLDGKESELPYLCVPSATPVLPLLGCSCSQVLLPLSAEAKPASSSCPLPFRLPISGCCRGSFPYLQSHGERRWQLICYQFPCIARELLTQLFVCRSQLAQPRVCLHRCKCGA